MNYYEDNIAFFERIYDSYFHIVYLMALKYTGNIEDARSISQEVFERVWKKVDEFKVLSTEERELYLIEEIVPNRKSD